MGETASWQDSEQEEPRAGVQERCPGVKGSSGGIYLEEGRGQTSGDLTDCNSMQTHDCVMKAHKHRYCSGQLNVGPGTLPRLPMWIPGRTQRL